jgi:hypothetical protein
VPAVLGAPGRDPWHRRAVGGVLATAALLAAAAGTSDGLGQRSLQQFLTAEATIRHRLAQTVRLPAIKRALDAELAARREASTLPLVRERAAGIALDFFGAEHGIIPLNGFRYQPRPMGGGPFNAYTPRLMAMNRDFLRDDTRAPAGYLVKLAALDGRLVAGDDALAFLELIHRYRPEAIDQGYILARRHPATAIVPELVRKQDVAFGERVAAPDPGPGRLLLVSFDFTPSLAGRVRAAAYKPSAVHLALEGPGVDGLVRRIIPRMAAVTTLLSPFVDDSADYLSLFGGAAARTVRAFSLQAARPQDFSRRIQVTFHSVPAPAPLEARQIAGLTAFLRFPLTNVPVDRLAPQRSLQRMVHGRLMQELSAPAEVAWNLAGTERVLAFDYGFAPEAYERGLTNGAIVLVELVRPDGFRQPVFRRNLFPRQIPADRGIHRAEVALPPMLGQGELVLRVDPGLDADTEWDWVGIARVQLQRGPFVAAQFPGFNRAPVSLDAPGSSLEDRDGPLRLVLPPPAKFTVELQGGESVAALGFGLLPGAYGDGGRSDGVGFTVERQRAGQPPVQIFHRVLEPFTREEDRGEQQAQIPLHAAQAGDRLVFAIDAGRHGNNSWDWPFISHLQIK